MSLILKQYSKSDFKIEILSGLTVALALVPEAVAFAFVAGVEPLVGLYAAFIVCLVTSIFGGRPAMISGATGALAVVMVSLVSDYGVETLFATIILMGIIQALVGVLKLGKFIRLVPQPVILGFVNGLAIVIFMAQVNQLKVTNSSGVLKWMHGEELYIMLSLILATMAVIYFLPKLIKSAPSSLVAILLTSMAVIFFDIPTKTVGDLASISGSFPTMSIPAIDYNFEIFKIIFPYALILAGIGLIESLLTLTLVDELTETRGSSNRECIAQGGANILAGLFGSMGGCAMIGQSMINVSSGARKRLSGIIAGLSLLAFILIGSSLIEQVPIAALIGVMVMVCIGTFEWTSFYILHRIPKADAFVLVLVTSMTVVFDLAIAVILGVIVSALVFAWQSATRIRARKSINQQGEKLYEIWGPLFFASTSAFQEKFSPAQDPDVIVVDFLESRIADHSAIEAIQKLTQRYDKLGKTVRLRHLSQDCLRLLDKAKAIIEVNIEEDPHYVVATDDVE